MAVEKRIKVYFKNKATFLTCKDNGTITGDHLCFIEDTKEIWTHNQYFSAGNLFKNISDGTNTASSTSTDGTIRFWGDDNKISVSVDSSGVHISGANATVATGDGYGQVKIDGQNVTVNGWSDTTKTLNDFVLKTTTVNGHALSSNVSVTASDVGLGNVTNESKATMFTSPDFTGTPTAPTADQGTNTTQIATTAFVTTAVNNLLGASDAMIFKGTIGTGGTVTALPNTHKSGDTYKVTTAGTYAGIKCEVGDMIICVKDGTTAANADWTVVQTNIDGAVTGPASAVNNRVATFNGTTGKVIKDSGYTIATSVPSGAVFTDLSVTDAAHHYTPTEDTSNKKTAGSATGSSGTTVQAISAIKLDAKGHVTGIESVAATDTTYSTTTGSGINITDTVITNSGVRSVATGTTNGTINVNTNGTTAAVSVYGLGSAAYTDSTAYATAAQGTLATNAVPNTRKVNEKALSTDITLDGSDIKLTGYTQGTSVDDVAATDTINAAFAKLMNRVEAIEYCLEWAEYPSA